MARTKTKPGPKPKYGEREEIHVLIPIDDMNYIRSVTDNVTEWVIQAVREKRKAETPLQPEELAKLIRDVLIHLIPGAETKLLYHYHKPITQYLIDKGYEEQMAVAYSDTLFDIAWSEFRRRKDSVKDKDVVKEFEECLYQIMEQIYFNDMRRKAPYITDKHENLTARPTNK